MAASAQLPHSDRPLVGTGSVLLALLFLILLFVVLLFAMPFATAQSCVTGYAGPVTDASGKVVQEGHNLETSCTSFDWAPVVGLGVLGALVGAGIFGTVAQVRRYARRWNSPLYGPLVWTIVTGALLALVLFVVADQPWWESQSTICDVSGCKTTNHFEIVGTLVVWAVIAVPGIPFLISIRNLIVAWLRRRAVY